MIKRVVVCDSEWRHVRQYQNHGWKVVSESHLEDCMRVFMTIIRLRSPMTKVVQACWYCSPVHLESTDYQDGCKAVMAISMLLEAHKGWARIDQSICL